MAVTVLWMAALRREMTHLESQRDFTENIQDITAVTTSNQDINQPAREWELLCVQLRRLDGGKRLIKVQHRKLNGIPKFVAPVAIANDALYVEIDVPCLLAPCRVNSLRFEFSITGQIIPKRAFTT